MKMIFFGLLIVLGTVVGAKPNQDTVTFFGAGYAMAPLRLAGSSTSVHLQLRTARPDALLLLAAGSTDYLLMLLQRGVLKVRVNLGAGEGEVSSPSGIHLSDLKWHDVRLQRKNADVYLTIDGAHASQIQLPGQFVELNIEHGVLVGGLGGFSELFLGVQNSFRGCLRNVSYDGRPIVQLAKKRNTTSGILSGKCAPQISAQADTPFGFMNNSGYAEVSVAAVTPKSLNIKVSVRTFKRKGVLAYGEENGRSSVYLLLEVTNGRLQLLAAVGAQSNVVRSAVFISDGAWHDVSVAWNSSSVILIVDEAIEARTNNASQPQPFKKLILGSFGRKRPTGLAQNRDASFREQFKGCLRNAVINGERTGFPDVLASEGVSAGCDPELQCVSCTSANKCGSDSSSQGKCQCPHATCDPGDAASTYEDFSTEAASPLDLTAPVGEVLNIPLGSRLKLDRSVLRVQNYPGDPKDLVYYVVSATAGRVQLADRPGIALASFTQAQMDENIVELVPTSVGTSKITIRVTNRASFALPVSLEVTAFPLRISQINNTVLTVLHQTYALVTERHLSFSVNDPAGSDSITFIVTSPPGSGQLQRLRTSGRWQTTKSFTMRHIQRRRVRYQHTRAAPQQDSFRFQVSYRGVEWPDTYVFRIKFVVASVTVVTNRELVLNRAQEAVISQQHLLAETQQQTDSTANITYSIVETPRFGDMFREWNGPRELLILGSVFFQQDIAASGLIYRLHRRSVTAFRDQFRFRVSAGTSWSEVQTFRIRHVPARSLGMIAIQRISVKEGASVALTNKQIRIDIPTVDAVLFNVTSLPKHGKLLLGGNAHGSSVSLFTSRDLAKGRLEYKHDDTETRQDQFRFVASSLRPGDALHYVGMVRVEVALQNDQPPKRLSSRPLYVIRGGRRAVWRSVLEFSDADLGTTARQLVYTRRVRRYPSNGQSVPQLYLHPDYQTPVEKFSQADINANRLVLQHAGPEHFNISLWVSDGVHYAATELRVEASAPFVRVKTAPSVAVPRGEIQPITSVQLQPETNVEVTDDNVRLLVTQEPLHGTLRMRGDPVTAFSYRDVIENNTEYEHGGDGVASDFFSFEIQVGKISSTGSLRFRVLPESYWEPLKVIKNETALVGEGGAIVITEDMLHLQHTSVDPSHVLFTVAHGPTAGFLVLRDQQTRPEVIIFSQALLSAGNLSYVQSASNATEDSFTFSVTNGIVSSPGLQFRVEVIPRRLRLVTKNVTLAEGSSVTLPRDVVTAASRYYRRSLKWFQVTRPPRSGKLAVHGQKEAADNFTVQQLRAGEIQYVHDGDESREDCLTGVLHTTNASSAPGRLCFQIEGVSDQPPRIVNNTGIAVFAGGVAAINVSQLDARDLDDPPDELTFLLAPSECASVSLTSDPGAAVSSFLRSHLELGKVLLTSLQSELDSCRLNVSVDDGMFRSPPTLVQVSQRPLQLRMVHTSALLVFPMMQQSITRRHLLAVTDDPVTPRDITYTVLEKPRLGKVTRELQDGRTREVRTFTQADINGSRVLYEQFTPLDVLSAEDAITLRAETPHAPALSPVVLPVRVSVTTMTRGGLRSYIMAAPLTLMEGGSADVTADQLDVTGVEKFLQSHSAGRPADIRLQLTTPPRHGRLNIEGRDKAALLKQEDITRGRLSYRHDHSDTRDDSFGYTLLLMTPESRQVPLYNGSVIVAVTPVNDQPFRLLTPVPGLTVVQKQSAVIGPRHVHVTDDDNSPDEIIYSIINGPSRGQLRRASQPKVKVKNFTQEDVDQQVLSYTQDGSLGEDQFHFSVWDGQHAPLVMGFVITIIPLTLDVGTTMTAFITQGDSKTGMSADVIAVTTNGERSGVFFNITSQPQNGKLTIAGKAVEQFSLADVDAGHFTYVQMDMQASSDSFAITVFDEVNVLESRDVQVRVRPLLQTNILRVVPGQRAVISLRELNASQLASIARSNPTFRLTGRARYGFVAQRPGGTGGVPPSWNLTTFTHADVVQQVVVFVTEHVPLGENETLTDTLSFELTAGDVQPAAGQLTVQLISAAQMEAGKAPPGVNSVVGRDVWSDGPTFGADLVLVCGGVAAAAVSSLLLLLVVRCLTKRRAVPEAVPVTAPSTDCSVWGEQRTRGDDAQHCSVIPLSSAAGSPGCALRHCPREAELADLGTKNSQCWV